MIRITIEVDGQHYDRKVVDAEAAVFYVENQLKKHFRDKNDRELDCTACYFDKLEAKGHAVNVIKLFSAHRCGKE